MTTPKKTRSSLTKVKERLLAPLEQAPKLRRPYGTKGMVIGPQPTLSGPTQSYVLLGQDKVLMASSQTQPGALVPSPPSQEAQTVGTESQNDTREILRKERGVTRRQKFERQAMNWKVEVIPQLIRVHMDLVRCTDSFKDLTSVRAVRREGLCRGNCSTAHASMHTVTILERKAFFPLSLCLCVPIAEQLVSLGYFPCAPYRLSLAVCIDELEFSSTLFMNTTPNVTAWCDTTLHFLRKHGIRTDSLESVRRRFSASQRWYRYMLDCQECAVREHLFQFRATASTSVEPNTTECSSDSSDNSNRKTTPSNYLRDCCPICFGSNSRDDLRESGIADAIVQIDANFTHKRRRTKDDAKDPVLLHPSSAFIEKSALDKEEALVNSLRQPRPTDHANNPDNDEDTTEPGMRVPKSSLDECGKSFNAANEKRQASSTSVFADRGIMALLCRHERVLWLANITTPGERQFIALTLLRRLFEHLPNDFVVGLCYDIACQLDRSCNKWGFLEEFLPRLKFAVSIFHAFAHQWACQLIYHPRKLTDFGLTDGEGVERFWAMLKLFIPILRVSGYHYRLYTLDSKIKHRDDATFIRLGDRIKKLWFKSIESLADADKKLDNLLETHGLSLAQLRSEFDNQVVTQTKPFGRQSKTLAEKKVRLVMNLVEERRTYTDERDALQNQLSRAEGDEQAEIKVQLEDVKVTLNKLHDRIKNHRAALGVDGRASLKRLLGDAYLKERMNALALKQRLRSRLCSRRMELSQIERALRKASTNSKKLASHASHEMKRKEPGITQLAKKYNNLCDKISDMINRGQAPRNALKPVHVPLKGLFKLDVDDAIWQDVGLFADDGEANVNTDPPGWLAAEEVRSGIRHMLSKACCEKELARLKHEKRAMMAWAAEEWDTLSTALRNEKNQSLVYLLQRRIEKVCDVAREWERQTRVIPHGESESWVTLRLSDIDIADDSGSTTSFPSNSVESDPEENMSIRAEEADCFDLLEESYIIGGDE